MIIQFGSWRLVPSDASNWELEHRRATVRGDHQGELRWHRCGRYYQYNTIANALWFAATWELAHEGGVAVVGIRDALREFERICNDLTRDAQDAVRNLCNSPDGPQSGKHE